MSKHTIVVLRGGPGAEYDISLDTGAALLSALPPERYRAEDVFIDRSGVWHRRGVPRTPAEILHTADAAINALHGRYGEGGYLQALLDSIGVPYTGPDRVGGAISINKALAKQRAEALGIRTPAAKQLTVTAGISGECAELFRSVLLPCVVKPRDGGAGFGVTLARDFEAFCRAIAAASRYGGDLLLEEYIEGRHATVGVIEDFRGVELYTTFPAEKMLADNGTASAGSIVCPGLFSAEESRELQTAARAIHTALDLRHYSRSDFVVSRRGIYFLEVNAVPGVGAHSSTPRFLEAAGAGMDEFAEHFARLALANARR